MNRRDTVVCLLWSAALSGRVHAQQTGKVYYIAIVAPAGQPSEMSETSPDQALARLWGAFFGELRRLGYVEGKNLRVERYSGEGLVEAFVILRAVWFVAIRTSFIQSLRTCCSRSKERPRRSQSLD